MTITLPLPVRALSPNSRSHWAVRHRASKKARQRARVETLAAARDASGAIWGANKAKSEVSLTLTGYFSARRRRDHDNFIASLKPSFDGIADALDVDDSRFRIAGVDLGQVDRENPRVEIEIQNNTP